VPFCGLIWNEKLAFFGTNIKNEERFFRTSEFNPSLVIDRLLNAIEDGYDLNHMMAYKKTAFDSLNDILRMIDEGKVK
jgi:hypothetical protein